MRLVTGSSVENSLSWTTTPALLNALNRVLFPRVGVSNQRDHGQAGLLPAAHVRCPALADKLQLLIEPLDPFADEASVRLQLGFPGAPGPYSATQPLQVGPLARQPGQQVPVLGQLHL